MSHLLDYFSIKKLFAIIYLFTLLTLPLPSFAAEKIDKIEVTISVNEDSSIMISERIEYDFGNNQKHGIYRTIPVEYSTSYGFFNLRISDITVTDNYSNEYPVKETYEDHYLKIRIGSPDITVTGKKTYNINYVTARAINFFDDFDELYWNAVGAEWTVPIEKAKAVIIIPKTVPHDKITQNCFFGPYGSKSECKSEIIDTPDKTTIIFKHDKVLMPGNGMTIAAALPKGIVHPPTLLQKIMYLIKDNGILAIPLFTLIFMYRRWSVFGRDPDVGMNNDLEIDITTELTPIEVGAIFDESVSKDALTAQIVYLATLGYLSITKTEEKGVLSNSTDYVFERLKESDTLIKSFDKQLLDGLIPGTKGSTKKLSELKNKFNRKYNAIKKDVIKSVTAAGYFKKNPASVRSFYLGIAALLLFLSFLMPAHLGFGLLGFISIFLTAIILAIFGSIMPQKTELGAKVQRLIEGLKEYLEELKTDKNRLLNELKQDSEQFERLLPYAMVLGVENEWAEHFKDIYSAHPDWYHGHYGYPYYPSHLTNDLRSFSSCASNTLGASASSGGSGTGGGGFSGGGGGGGGGGSW